MLVNTNRFAILFFIFMALQVMSQDIAIGQWRDHLSYNKATSVAQSSKHIFCVANGNLYKMDKTTFEVERMSKANGLSDFDITDIAYDNTSSTLIITYRNTNIDIVKENKVYNLRDILNKSILGNKTINSVAVKNDFAYLACGFGIVVIDLNKLEIKDTYNIQFNGNPQNVNEISFSSTEIFAATNRGVYRAEQSNPFLSAPSSWNTMPGFDAVKHKSIAYFNNQLYTIIDNSASSSDIYFFNEQLQLWQRLDTTQSFFCNAIKSDGTRLIACYRGGVYYYNTSKIRDDQFTGFETNSETFDGLMDGEFCWIADFNNGLIKRRMGTFEYSVYRPNGPESNDSYYLKHRNGVIYSVPGGAIGLSPRFRRGGISYFTNNEWFVLPHYIAGGPNDAYDLMTIDANPEDKDNIFIGSWGRGVVEIKNKEAVANYNNRNSELDSVFGFSAVLVQGLMFDNSGNLWISNAAVQNPLVVYTKNKNWMNFNFPGLNLPNVQKLIVTRNNQKWLIAEKTGAFVYDDNNTIENKGDDQFKHYTFEVGKGGITGSDIFCIEEDLNGEIWIGTDKGVSVIYSPEQSFDNSAPDAQQIKIEQDGYVQFLLESEQVTAIKTDAANRKWIGTANSGVYLMNQDGTKQLKNFTIDNSPLVSNNINSIEILESTGEVFFATDKGIMSYKDVATEGLNECNDILVYPNPVRSNHQGVIAIRGLVNNAIVKITDATGNLVQETNAFGGQAIWDGTDARGNKVPAGVYFVFAADKEGNKGCNTKILIAR